MKHSFDIEIAMKVGVQSAILFDNFVFWIAQNKANGTNYFDGRTWTYNTQKAYTMLFPYMTEKQIKYAIQKLVENDLIIKGNYNNEPHNHTNWYALKNEQKWLEPLKILNRQNCPIERTKLSNRTDKIVQSTIQIINTNNKPYIYNTSKKPSWQSGELMTSYNDIDFDEFEQELLNHKGV